LTALLYVVAFAFGAVLGSFLNVCIHRLPRGMSIVKPPSHCPRCGSTIRFYDNIPLVSFLLLRGRCRTCGAPISLRYPLVEALTGMVAVGSLFAFGLRLEAVVAFGFLAALEVVTFVDLEHRIIPDEISLGGMVVGLLLAAVGVTIPFKEALLGSLVGGGGLWLVAFVYEAVAKREGMGGGDIKLMGMIGAFLGYKGALFAIFGGALLGAFVGGALMVAKGADSKYAIPFGPFLSLGAAVYLFAGEGLVSWYLTLLRG